MILTIDVGNTNIVVGVYRKDELILTLRLKTDATKTEDEYMILFNSSLRVNHLTPEEIEGSIISSVVPNLSAVLAQAVQKLTGHTPLIVGPGIKTGLPIKIDDPSQLGSDLVVAAVGALQKYAPPLILIDMGTATTFSAVDASGNFLGGAIIPGLRVSLGALTQQAAQISQIDLSAPKKAIGTNTNDSLRSGLILGCADMIDGMCKRFKEELGGKATVIATGGLAAKVLPYCSTEVIIEPDLLPNGLLTLYKKNQK